MGCFVSVFNSVFPSFQWRWPLFIFMSYRILATCYVTGWLIYSTVHSTVINGFIWPVYLTNWGFTALCLHLWVSTMLTVGHAITHRHFFCEAPPLHRSMGTPVSATDSEIDFQEDGQDDVGFVMPTDRLPWYCKLSWVLFNIIANGAIIVSVVFFAGLYPQIYKDGQFPTIEDFHLHAVNSMIILLELMFSALPIRILHFVFVQMFGIAYAGMSLLLYYFYTKEPIYPKILDWNHPLPTGLTVAGLILIAAPLLHIILFSLYKYRVFIFRKLYDFD